MTDHRSVCVFGQGNIAMRAFQNKTAAAAGHKAGIPSSVEKKHRLMPFPQNRLKPRSHFAAQNGAVAFFQFLFHINDADRSSGGAEPSPEPDQAVNALPGLFIGEYGRRRRAEKKFCAFDLTSFSAAARAS